LEDSSKPISSYEMPRPSNERAGPTEVVLDFPLSLSQLPGDLSREHKRLGKEKGGLRHGEGREATNPQWTRTNRTKSTSKKLLPKETRRLYSERKGGQIFAVTLINCGQMGQSIHWSHRLRFQRVWTTTDLSGCHIKSFLKWKMTF
jgi:hypothetical protein